MRGKVISELLRSGLVDWVSLHDVVWLCTGGTINPETKRAVLDVLGSLYSDELMIPGDLGESGFEDWEPPSEGWVLRSEIELDRLGWSPMGEGFWLRLAPEGERKARQADARGNDDSG
jgi:hypothetical protein